MFDLLLLLFPHSAPAHIPSEISIVIESSNNIEIHERYSMAYPAKLSYKEEVIVEDLFSFFAEEDPFEVFYVQNAFSLNAKTDRIILGGAIPCGGCDFTYPVAIDYTPTTGEMVTRPLFTNPKAPNWVVTKGNYANSELSPDLTKRFHLDFPKDAPPELWVYDFQKLVHTRVAKLKGTSQTLLTDDYGRPIKPGLIYWQSNSWLHVNPQILLLD